jgi:hypothetical protein
MTDRYSGDPKIKLTENGADFEYQGGQPVMDQGFENCAQLSLFTREGWAGNLFLGAEEQVGSDYEKTCEGAVTLSKLTDIENAAERALKSKVFGTVTAKTINPTGNQIYTEITIGAGGALKLTREGALWAAQIKFPASRRITNA